MSGASAAARPLHGPGRSDLPALPPLALYVHVPWCVRKCPYCDFNSHELRGELPETAYVDALVADLESALPAVWGRRVDSVFIGGGTPSLLSVAALDRLLSAVRARLRLAPDAEITLEANPGTVEYGKFAGFRALGINRLSLGIQSFDDGHLRALGRIHDGAQACQAVEAALACFDNVNLDLMYALPGQSLAQACADLDRALGFAPQHLSAYHLTIEPNTWFHRHPPALPDDDVAADMQEALEARLAAAGYEHYETSAFARPGRACRHNRNYWRFGDYLGIGAGAHGKLSLPGDAGWRIVRQTRPRHPREYQVQALRPAPAWPEQVVDAGDLPFEFAMNALRLTGGFEATLFQERTGLPLTALLPALERAVAAGWVERDHQWIRPTPRGARFLNDLLGLFLP